MLKYPKNYIKRTETEFEANVNKFLPFEEQTAKLMSIILNDNNYDLNKNKYYDIIFNDRDLMIEVKCDRKMNETGNIFIETGYKNRPSGLYITKAQLICICDNNDKYYLIPRIILKELVKNLKLINVDKFFKCGYLLKKELLLKNSIELNEWINNKNSFCNIF